LATKALELNFN